MRTQEQVLAEMNAVQSKLPDLAELNSTSNASLFGWLKNLFALLWLQVESFIERANADAQVLLDERQIGNANWYARQAKNFQYGDTPNVLPTGQVAYASVDPAKQIVKQAVCVPDPQTGALIIKAVKATGPASFGPLTGDELAAFKSYLNLVKYAGVSLNVVSLPAQELRLTVSIRLNPLVVKPNGESLTAPNVFPVTAALQSYLAQLPFDSVFSWTALTDYMQQQPSVSDFVVLQAAIRNPGQTGWTAIPANFTTSAGYLTLIIAESTLIYT